jgi:hypothetical protein
MTLARRGPRLGVMWIFVITVFVAAVTVAVVAGRSRRRR